MGLSRERSSAQEGEKSAEAQITGFKFALTEVLNGQFTTNSQLQALVDPKFRVSGGNPYLLGGDNDFLRINGSVISQKSLGGGRLAAEDFVLLGRFLNIADNPSFPNEVKENLKQYLKTNNLSGLERLNTIMAAAKDDTMSSEVNSLVADLIKTRRVVELKKDVYGGIVANKPNGELSKKISEFEGKETSDIELAAELQAAVAAKRKREIISSINGALQLQGRDIDKVLTEAAPLLGSERPDEREAGIQLVKAAYTAELTNFKNEVQKMITKDVDPEMLRIFIGAQPIRPEVGGIDYVRTIVDTRDKAFASVGELLKARGLEAATRIRENFASQGVDLILASIDNFPGETERDLAVKDQLLELYKSYVAANKSEVFDNTFAKGMRVREQEELKAKFVSSEKGMNKDAFRFMRSRFVETIYPLVEFLRVDETTTSKISRSLDKNLEKPGAPNPRQQFEQQMASLEGQRELTDTERSYLQSVELLSVFNPYLVACAFADRGVTSEFLRHHFETLSRKTTAALKDGDYFPLIQIGTGPNGLAALGEIVRNNSDLASAMLVVDAGKQPGGPFAIPEGAAWRLNSASKGGSGVRALPEAPGKNELKTVRAYGSPLRWYPGERSDNDDVRQASINTTVDYLPTPDDLISSAGRYPTNEELQIILSLQAAVLTKNAALRTKVIGLEKNSDPNTRGDKLVTLEVTDETGTRTVKITTDALFGATGLGEPGYGFKLEGSRAEKVLSAAKEAPGFPKISQTLEAFNAFAGRSNEQLSPGKTLVIYGGGNSADTLIEYVGRLFQGDNPVVRDVTKLYLISEKELSSRPRYKLIEDLRGRNGRGNLIEEVRTKVADVDFETQEGEPAERKLVFYDRNNQLIKNERGVIITGDSAIAATGFRSKLDSLVEKYAEEKTGDERVALRKFVTLPTNERVPVAETLTSDSSVLILGTASEPDFQKNLDKLDQLPVEAREALLRNGAENAVAIGFRAPDTQAAVNIWLNSRDIEVEKKSAVTERKNLRVAGGETITPGEIFWLNTVVSSRGIRIPNDIADERRVLSPLFIYNVGNSVELTNPDGRRFNGELDFTMVYNPENKMLGLTFNEENNVPMSKEVIDAIKDACMDTDFQKYALVALRKKRRNPKLDLVLSFKNGYVDPKTTFVQG